MLHCSCDTIKHTATDMEQAMTLITSLVHSLSLREADYCCCFVLWPPTPTTNETTAAFIERTLRGSKLPYNPAPDAAPKVKTTGMRVVSDKPSLPNCHRRCKDELIFPQTRTMN